MISKRTITWYTVILAIGAGACGQTTDSQEPALLGTRVSVVLNPNGSEAKLTDGRTTVTIVTRETSTESGRIISVGVFDSAGRRIAASLAQRADADAWPTASPDTEADAVSMNDAFRFFATSFDVLDEAAEKWSGHESEHQRLVKLARLSNQYVEQPASPGSSSQALQIAPWLPANERDRLSTYLGKHNKPGMTFLSYQVYARPVGWVQAVGQFVSLFQDYPQLKGAEHSAGIVANGYITLKGNAVVVSITESAIDLPQPFGSSVSEFIGDAETRHVCTGTVPERTYDGIIDTCFPDGKYETPNVLYVVPEGYFAEGVCNNHTRYEIDQFRLPAGISPSEKATIKTTDCGVPGVNLDDIIIFFPTSDWCQDCYLEGDACCSSAGGVWSWCSDPNLKCASGVCVPQTPKSPCQGLANGYYCASNPSLDQYSGPGDIVLCQDDQIAAEKSCPIPCIAEAPNTNDHCCGDGVCETKTNTESCSTCPVDCGTCDVPTAKITAPADGAVVTGAFVLKGSATDQTGLQKVTAALNWSNNGNQNVPLCSGNCGSTYSINTTLDPAAYNVPSGSKLTIAIWTKDLDGNVGAALSSITVTWNPAQCASSADCNDGNACTTDTCSGGKCQQAPLANGTPCGVGKVCNGGQCVVSPQCATNADCDDGNTCTSDACSGGQCQQTALANGAACPGGACQNGQCQAAACANGARRRCWVECVQNYSAGCIHGGLPPLIMGAETCSGGQWGACVVQQTCDAALVDACANGSSYQTSYECMDGSLRQGQYGCFKPLGASCNNSYHANWPVWDCPQDLCLTGDDACPQAGATRPCSVFCNNASGMTRQGTQSCTSYCGNNLAWGPCLTNDGCLQ